MAAMPGTPSCGRSGAGTQFGTPLESYPSVNPNTPTAMLSNVKKQYLKLKRQAMRLMLTGDLKRYMETLHRMHELRAQGLAA